MSYNIVFLPEVEKYLAALNHSSYSCIKEGMKEIQKDPYSNRPNADIMKLGVYNDAPTMYRLRVGRYRLEYFIDEKAKKIRVDKVIDLKVDIFSSYDYGIKFNSKAETLDLKTLDKAETLNPNGKSTELGSKSENLNLELLEEAVKGANGSRQTIAIWSPEISAVLWYLKKTIPEFSISEEARSLLEKRIVTKYPELYKLMSDKINRNN